MKNITMIAAVGKNLELGYDNQLLWRIPEDMRFFRQATMHKPILMGRKTWESLPGLLPGRKHYVLTRGNLDLEGVTCFCSLDEVLTFASRSLDEVMVIGGASVYEEMLPYADKLILTEVSDSLRADCYFPSFSKEDWNQELLGTYQEGELTYKRLVYKRK